MSARSGSSSSACSPSARSRSAAPRPLSACRRPTYLRPGPTPPPPPTQHLASPAARAHPLSASGTAGEPCRMEYEASCVDGIGARAVLAERWPLVSTLLAGACVVSLEEICAAIRMLVTRMHVVAEGAGGSSLAAA